VPHSLPFDRRFSSAKTHRPFTVRRKAICFGDRSVRFWVSKGGKLPSFNSHRAFTRDLPSAASVGLMSLTIENKILRRRWSIKGLDVATLLIVVGFLSMFVVPIFGFDILPGRAESDEIAIGMLLVIILIAVLALLVKTVTQSADVILTPEGVTVLGLRQKEYRWDDYGPPQLSYVTSRHRPGRCLALKPLTAAGARRPMRIFDWYDADLDSILNYIINARPMAIYGVVDVPGLIPSEKNDRLKGPLALGMIVFLMISATFNGAVALDLFGIAEPVRELRQKAHDAFDPRPVQTILVIGNSRTSQNDMPGMLRALADADHYTKAIQFKMGTINGSTFESQWETPRTQALLAQTWDGAIIQGESRGQAESELAKSFMIYGNRILRTIHLNSGTRPLLVINWCYDPSLFEHYPNMPKRADLVDRMQADQVRLAEESGARPVNVGAIWERVRATMPQLALTTDGNHPTQAATYLMVAALYADLSGRDVRNISYAPKGLDPTIASALRREVQDFKERVS
jgi:hypothetical protein